MTTALQALNNLLFEDIEIVWSHPQSLSQCAQYIADHGFDSVPFSNTAIAARDVAKESASMLRQSVPTKRVRNTA